MKNLLHRVSVIPKLFMILAMSAMLACTAGAIISYSLDKPQASVAIASVLFIVSMLSSTNTQAARLVFTTGICERIQAVLNDFVGSNAPSLRRTQVGYLQALQSPQNTAGVTKVPIPSNGKKRKVRFTYIQRATETGHGTTEITDCSTSVEREPLEDEIEVTNYLRTAGIKFTEDNMRLLCEDDNVWMQTIIMAEVDALVRDLNKRLIAIQLLNFGTFNPAQPGNKKHVILLTGNRKIANYNGEYEIHQEFENQDSPGRPIIIGNGNISNYVKQVGIGCCNKDGINMNQAGDMDFFLDRFVAPIIGTDGFIGLIPGMVQLLTWNKYVGKYQKENDVFSHSTFQDPVTGLTFDMKWHYNDCDDTYSLHFGVWYELFFIPDDAWNSSDELFGTNGSMNFVGTLETDYCC
jgi:hypothetical protein